MLITLNTSSRTFQTVFTVCLFIFAAVLFAAATYSWDGPSSSPPSSNVAAPINTGGSSQVKSGALSVNGLSVTGSEYISTSLGIGAAPGSSWRINAQGGTYGIYADATTGQAIYGHTSAGGWSGYFTGGPVYSQNYMRADGGFCIVDSCKTSWGWNFGGMYSTGDLCAGGGSYRQGSSGGGGDCNRVNPMTGGYSCPGGFYDSIIYMDSFSAWDNADNYIHLCWR